MTMNNATAEHDDALEIAQTVHDFCHGVLIDGDRTKLAHKAQFKLYGMADTDVIMDMLVIHAGDLGAVWNPDDLSAIHSALVAEDAHEQAHIAPAE